MHTGGISKVKHFWAVTLLLASDHTIKSFFLFKFFFRLLFIYLLFSQQFGHLRISTCLPPSAEDEGYPVLPPRQVKPAMQ